MWIIFLKFLLAHFLGDFVLQTKKMVQNKSKPKYFIGHILIHMVLLSLFLINNNMWWAIICVVVAHALIDYIKIKASSKVNASLLFVIDQIVHLLVIALVLCVFSTLQISFTFLENSVFWVSIIALVLTTQVTAVFIRILLSPYQHQKNNTSNDAPNNAFKFAAGKYIGMLERLFILGFVIGNFWEGIGFLLAAKSIFRFGDLNNAKERHLTEYVLIGTLLSFGCAILIGLLYNYFISFLNG